MDLTGNKKEAREAVIHNSHLIVRLRVKLQAMTTDPTIDGDDLLELRDKLLEVEGALDACLEVFRQSKDDIDSLLSEKVYMPIVGSGQKKLRGRKAAKTLFPEGSPLDNRVLEALQQMDEPCGYQEINEVVPGHHQSIQASLRNLVKAGHARKLRSNSYEPLERSLELTQEHD
jgi:hypothetical protein